MPANLSKRKQLEESIENLWRWLLRQVSFRFDYKNLRSYLFRNNMPPHEIRKKGKGYEILFDQDPQFRNCATPDEYDRKLASYKAKHTPLANHQQYERQEKFRKKWGFYPLLSNTEVPSNSFCAFVRRNFAKGHYNDAVRPLNSWGLPLPSLPKKFEVGIDLWQGDQVIFFQLKQYLKRMRKKYGIKPDKSRSDFAELVLKNMFLIRAGLSKAQIKKYLRKKKLRHEFKESDRKKLERAYAIAQKADT